MFKTRPSFFHYRIAAAFSAAALVLAAGAAMADGPAPLRVTMDKAEVVHLTAAAAVVLVANPAIADVVVERGKLLFVLGRRPGETRLYVYSDSGQRVIERDIVVVRQQERTVTITRGTRALDYGCDDRCAVVGVSRGTEDHDAPPADLPANTPAPQPAPGLLAATPQAVTAAR